MRILDVVRKSHASTPSQQLIPLTVATTACLLFLGVHSVWFGGAGLVTDGRVPFEFGLWIAGCFAAFVWWLALSLGWVGGGTGAGLALVFLGLVCRMRGTWSVLLLGSPIEDGGPVVRSVLSLAAFHRNAGLVAFGLGLGLVAASSTVDVVRRRRAPYWTRPEA